MNVLPRLEIFGCRQGLVRSTIAPLQGFFNPILPRSRQKLGFWLFKGAMNATVLARMTHDSS
jgi:hypothetical protein